MDNWVRVIGAITGFVMLLIILGGAWALIRGSFNQARVKELREEIEDLDRKDARKDKEIGELKAHNVVLESTVHAQQGQIDTLTSTVTQRAEVDALTKMIKDHHQAAMEHWDRLGDALDAIVKRMEEIRDEQ